MSHIHLQKPFFIEAQCVGPCRQSTGAVTTHGGFFVRTRPMDSSGAAMSAIVDHFLILCSTNDSSVPAKSLTALSRSDRRRHDAATLTTLTPVGRSTASTVYASWLPRNGGEVSTLFWIRWRGSAELKLRDSQTQSVKRIRPCTERGQGPDARFDITPIRAEISRR